MQNRRLFCETLPSGRMRQSSRFRSCVAFSSFRALPRFRSRTATEARFAQASKQMLETGDIIDIRLQDKPRYKKPAGIYWLQAAAVTVARSAGAALDDIWAYRIPSSSWRARRGAFDLLGGPRRHRSRTRLDCSRAFRDDTHAFIRGAHRKVGCGADGKHHALARRAVSPLHGAAGNSDARACGAVLVRTCSRHPHQGTHCARPCLSDFSYGSRRHPAPRLAQEPALEIGRPLLLLITLPWLIAIGFASNGDFFTQSVAQDFAGKLQAPHEKHWGPPASISRLSCGHSGQPPCS